MEKQRTSKYKMRTPQEKEAIVLEAFDKGVAKTWNKYNVSETSLYEWIRKYKANGIHGLESQTGKLKTSRKGNPYKGLQVRKNLSREEQLELENLKLKVEVARLKKGYLVKGVGRKKEYVTIKNLNLKS